MSDRLEWIQEMPEDHWKAFQEVVEARAEGKINRREWLKFIGVGGAAMAGGAAATGSAMAQGDENDGVGDVGKPNNRVDVFADGVDTHYLSGADISNAANGTYPTAQGDGTLEMREQSDFDVEGFSTSGVEGSVPTAQSDGSLAMDTGAGTNVPNWEEDANSPISESSVSSATISLDKTYDEVMIRIKEFTVHGSDIPQVRFNGQSSDYYSHHPGGSSRTGESALYLKYSDAPSGTSYFGELLLSANASDGVAARFTGGPRGDQGEVLLNGSQTSISSSLNSITFLARSGSNVSVEGDVFGRLIA